MLGDTVDATDAAVLYDDSGGNPFYLEQLARSLDREHDDASVAATSRSGVPSAVATSLGDELSQMSETGRLVLDGAAVAGDPFDPSWRRPRPRRPRLPRWTRSTSSCGST